MAGSRQSNRFLLLYALAWAGGSVAYVPFLTILLPVKVSLLAGAGGEVTWLAYIAFAGAIAASLGHIGFGYLSDITGNRRGWIWLGLIVSCCLLVAVTRATGLVSMIAIVLAWQLGLNMMLAPLSAWAGDSVPHSQKGLLGGLLAFAPGCGALAGAFVTIPGLAPADGRLWLVALIVAACVVPVLTIGSPEPVEEPVPSPEKTVVPEHPDGLLDRNGAKQRMWLARLAVQVAEAALFSYLYFWFRSIDPAMSDSRTARILSVVLVLSAPVAVWTGQWADRHRRPVVPLIVCSALSCVGLMGMAFAQSLPAAIGAYALFGLATSIFLALHSAQTLRVLTRSDRRGRDLGVFNLTNTVPSLFMPWLTLALVPRFGFSGLLLVLSALAAVAGLLLVSFPRRT
ncbi:MFS transporter [Novosphingobium sp.]|uniref:MFS transporter n=1 Tax=Novosphingobium sp. TaxID=1874826 RepID=UPI0025E32B5E|nr:MFS transporter [Novosphingobium sp.]